MTSILHRTIAHTYPVATRGEGIYLWDATGKQYIDASGGAAVSCLGHGHPDVLAAMHAQLDKLAYAHTWPAISSRTHHQASATSIS
jgi:adenosylmethionine-8-amino-7-oxononanoate aminotransferase